jgi:adenylyltransferase/sulfurtransferase
MGDTAGINAQLYQRYKRNIQLAGVGIEGQEKLLRASVLLVGAGGLGSPAAFYLAAAGVGRIGLVDNDVVSLSNLQRQILHATPDLGRPKVVSAGEKLKAVNPDLQLDLYQAVFRRDSAADLVKNYDFIIDCTDSIPSRHVINEACLKMNKPSVYGGVLAWAGQVFTVVPGAGPCFRCVFRETPPADAPTTSEVGILGAVPGVVGVLQAAEALRFILGTGELLVGRILVYDALSATFCEVPVVRDPACPDCARQDRD